MRLLLAAVTTLALTCGCTVTAGDTVDSSLPSQTTGSQPSTGVESGQASSIPTPTSVALSTIPSYARYKFPHWSDLVPPRGCDTRDEILERDVNEPVEQILARDTRGCTTRVTIVDPYTGYLESGDDEVEIDHIVSLHDAWYAGAYLWTTAQREQFANDPLNLIATADNQNQSKGSRTPVRWKPANVEYQCEYATTYRDVKIKWGLIITNEQQSAIDSLLVTC